MSPPSRVRPAHWFDTHCHLHLLPDPGAAVDRAREQGVGGFLTIGTEVASSVRAVEQAREYEGAYAAVGLHPNEASVFSAGVFSELDELAAAQGVVAVGETGLDFYRDSAPPALQRESFVAHIDIARRREKTLILHIRNAMSESLALLEAELENFGSLPRMVFHCFSGSTREVKRAVGLGGYVSYAGNISFSKAESLREAAAATPEDRILVETDAPFLAPVPHRGKDNEPAHVALVGRCVADVRGMDDGEFAALTTANAHAVLGIRG